MIVDGSVVSGRNLTAIAIEFKFKLTKTGKLAYTACANLLPHARCQSMNTQSNHWKEAKMQGILHSNALETSISFSLKKKLKGQEESVQLINWS